MCQRFNELEKAGCIFKVDMRKKIYAKIITTYCELITSPRD